MADKRSIYERPIHEHGGAKYIRVIHPCDGVGSPINVDVYKVLDAFGVTSHPIAHAVKKLLCAGLRGKGSSLDDIDGAFDALWRAREDIIQQIKADAERRAAGGAGDAGEP